MEGKKVKTIKLSKQ